MNNLKENFANEKERLSSCITSLDNEKINLQKNLDEQKLTSEQNNDALKNQIKNIKLAVTFTTATGLVLLFFYVLWYFNKSISLAS
jgi:hypothetical protein